MKQAILPGVISGALLFALTPASALVVENQVTPQTLTQSGHVFVVKVTPGNTLDEIEVSVAAANGKLSPYRHANLFLAGPMGMADVPVAEVSGGNRVAYRFRLSPGLLSGSRFELSESDGMVIYDAQGKPQTILLPDGTIYTFALEDFQPAKAQSRRPRQSPEAFPSLHVRSLASG